MYCVIDMYISICISSQNFHRFDAGARSRGSSGNRATTPVSLRSVLEDGILR